MNRSTRIALRGWLDSLISLATFGYLPIPDESAPGDGARYCLRSIGSSATIAQATTGPSSVFFYDMRAAVGFFSMFGNAVNFRPTTRAAVGFRPQLNGAAAFRPTVRAAVEFRATVKVTPCD